MHIVRGKNDGFAFTLHLQDNVLEQIEIQRVKSRKRLVEYQQIRLIDYRRRELQFLMHTPRKVLDFFIRTVAQLDSLQPRRDSSAQLARRQPLESAEEGKYPADRHFSIKPSFFGHIANMTLGLFG